MGDECAGNRYSAGCRRIALPLVGAKARALNEDGGRRCAQYHGICCTDTQEPSGSTTSDSLGGELTLPMRVANALYEGPCVAVLSLTAPACAVIFAVESRNPATAGLDLSKRLMHTRVYGQGVAVAALVGVLAFVEVMGNDGGAYQVEAGRVVRKLHQDRG